MNCVLYKEVKTLPSKVKGEKDLIITNFYLGLENGEMIRIQPNSWTDSTGKKRSNTNVLNAIASSKLPF